MPGQCVVKSCWPHFGRRFLRFPKDPNQQRKWIEVLGVPELLLLSQEHLLNRKRVCDRHFSAADLCPAPYPGAPQRALRPGSVPVYRDAPKSQSEPPVRLVTELPVPEPSAPEPPVVRVEVTLKRPASTKDPTDQRCNSVLRENSNLIISNETIKYHIPIKEENERSNSPPTSENCQINENAGNHFFSSLENEIFIKTNIADTDDTEISLPCEDLQAKHEEQLDDELFLTCITHALNTMCPNDKLELKMRVLEVIKDIKRK